VTANSGVTGKTVLQLGRAQAAEGRKAIHSTRSVETQLRELDSRPGSSARERARLARDGK
jgi:hypothetical protein